MNEIIRFIEHDKNHAIIYAFAALIIGLIFALAYMQYRHIKMRCKIHDFAVMQAEAIAQLNALEARIYGGRNE